MTREPPPPGGRRIRALAADDREHALAVINTAARWYDEFLPEAERRATEMTEAQWDVESARMTWYGAFHGDALVGVAAIEPAGDAALLRHAYILPAHQRGGLGVELTRYLESRVSGVDRILVGTYKANYKARRALEKLGYRECTDSDAVLRKYYDIPSDHRLGSLAYEKPR